MGVYRGKKINDKCDSMNRPKAQLKLSILAAISRSRSHFFHTRKQMLYIKGCFESRCSVIPFLLHEYKDLFIDMDVRNNRSELAIANRHQER